MKANERDVRLFNLSWVEVKEWLKETDTILIPIPGTKG